MFGVLGLVARASGLCECLHRPEARATSKTPIFNTTAIPRGLEPPLFSVTGRRPLHWPAGPFTISRWGRNRTPQDKPSVLETERVPRRNPHLCFSTPCGSRTRPKRLERPPTSPEVERGIYPSPGRLKTRTGRGSLVPPAGAVAITWLARGHPLVSLVPLMPASSSTRAAVSRSRPNA